MQAVAEERCTKMYWKTDMDSHRWEEGKNCISFATWSWSYITQNKITGGIVTLAISDFLCGVAEVAAMARCMKLAQNVKFT